jgi:hypothetical protein
VALLTATGAYLLFDHDGPFAVERFTCGPTADGWRYDATREDPVSAAPLGRLEVRLEGGAVLLHAEAGGWVLRGAAAGGEVLWRRGDQERATAGDGFAGTSPVHLLIGARTGRARLHLVELTEPVLAPRTTSQQWRDLGEREHEGLAVQAFQVDDLATGERSAVHLAGDVVVAAPRLRLLTLTRS